jgi:hypothetical protein
VELPVAALKANPRAGFAYTQMICHNPSGPVLIGANDPCADGIGTPMIMHRASLTRDIARWGRPSSFEDWEMIARWLDAGLKWVAVTSRPLTCITLCSRVAAIRCGPLDHPARHLPFRQRTDSQFIDGWNERCQSFTYTKTADESMAKSKGRNSRARHLRDPSRRS